MQREQLRVADNIGLEIEDSTSWGWRQFFLESRGLVDIVLGHLELLLEKVTQRLYLVLALVSLVDLSTSGDPLQAQVEIGF